MSNMKMLALFAAGMTLSLTPGCLTLETQTTEPIKEPVKEPTLADNSKKELTQEDIDIIETQDTTGVVSAAREAADKLISDAKQEAEAIRQSAEKIMDAKTYEAEKKAEEIIAEAKKKATSEKSAIVKQYLMDQKEVAKKTAVKILTDAHKKAAEIIAAAKKQAAETKAQADKYAATVGKKAKKEYNKITAQMIANAKKSVADMTKQGGIDADKIRAESKKLFAEAQEYVSKQKKAADDYLSKKIKEADAEIVKAKAKMGKDMSSEKDAKPMLADSILTKILKGMKNDDYKEFTAQFTSDLKKNFTEKKFKALNAELKKTLGEYKKRSYLGSLEKGPMRMYLWKATFENAKKNDLVIRLTLGELDGKEQVFGFDISNR